MGCDAFVCNLGEEGKQSREMAFGGLFTLFLILQRSLQNLLKSPGIPFGRDYHSYLTHEEMKQEGQPAVCPWGGVACGAGRSVLNPGKFWENQDELSPKCKSRQVEQLSQTSMAGQEQGQSGM